MIKRQLPNGVRVLVESVEHVRSASIGLWCQTGSSHEREHEAGITHLIEHMLFKGTATRTAKQIAEEIEGRGGALNAFTDKEQTCYYVRVLADDVQNAVDVLADMMLNSNLQEEEIALEQGVILEEIRRSEDEPSDHVHDLHIQGYWPSHQLGKPVIGTKESVSSFSRDHLTDYMSRRYTADRVLLAAAGKLDVDRFLELAEEKLGGLAQGQPNDPLPGPTPNPGVDRVPKSTEQVHFCVGAPSVSLYDDGIYVATVLDGVLGGGMSSRLFQEIREKRGLAYAIGSYQASYRPGGMFTVYGGTSPDTWPEVERLVRLEFDKLMQEGPEPEELIKVKRSISGNIVLALEGMSARMLRMAKGEMVHGREIPVEETLEKIHAVTAEQVVEWARASLKPELIRVTAIGPFE